MTTPTPRSSIGVRVRPNANDFIKDLERQLKTKKQTFYVDVHANLKPANREIAEWARGTLKKIRAVVPVGANMLPATTELADWRRKQAGRKTNIPIGANLAGAYASLLTFRKIAGKDIEVNLKINTESANKAAERFEQAMARRGVSIPVEMDVDRSTINRTAQKIDNDLIQRLQSQGGVLIGVDADTKTAEAKVRSFAAQTPKVVSQVDADIKQARLKLLQLKAEAMAQKLQVDVEVKASGLTRVKKTFDLIEKQFGGNRSLLRSLDVGPFNLGKPGGLMGTLTTVTMLSSAVPAAVTAVSALSQVLMQLGGAASILPGALGAAAASMGTFTLGISGMSDAFDALKTYWTETPAQAATASRRMVQAQNQLGQAVREEATAQREVASARREATNDLRNLNNELRGSVLNEAQAILDLQKARDRLAQGGFANITEEAQAKLDVVKAEDNILNVRERNVQLQQRANEESAKGVEGSDKVQTALERQTRAAEQAAHALEMMASTQATSALGKFQQELDQLTPNARDFMMVLFGMRGGFEDLRNMVQETMFQGLGPQLQNFLNQIMPVIGPGMQRIAGEINGTIGAVFDSLGGPQGQSILERILGGTAETQKALTGLVDPVVRGLGTLMAAGTEHLPQLVDLITRLAERFAVFIEKADKSGALDKFMDEGIEALGNIAEIGINALKIINDLSNAFEGDLLGTIVELTDKLHEFLSSTEGQQQIKDFIKEAGELWESWRPILEDLPGIFSAISDAAVNVLNAILPILNGITSAMKEFPGLTTAIITGWLGVKVLVGAASPLVALGTLISTMVTNAAKLPKLLRNVAQATPPGGLPGSGGGGGGGRRGGGGGGVAPVLGSAGVVAAGTLALTDIMARVNFAGDAESIYNEWKTARGQLGSADEKRQLDKEFFKNIGVDIGNETIYPLPSAQAFKGMLQTYDPSAGPQFRAHDGKIWFGDKPVSDSWGAVSFNKGGLTDWGETIGKMAVLHGGEYIEPKTTVDHYGVEAMEAIHSKRVPRGLLQSFWGGGLFDPFKLAPGAGGAAGDGGITPSITPTPSVPYFDPNLTAPPTATAPSTTPTTTHGTPGTLPGPPPGSALANTPVGPMATDANAGSSFNLFGIEIPFGQAQQNAQNATPVNFSDPAIWPFGVPGIGAPGTTKADAGMWLADWGAKTLMGFGEAVLGGVLGFFGAEGILSSPYFNAMRTTLGYYSALPGAVSQSVTAPGAADTAAQVDALGNAYYGLPQNPTTGAPGSLPQIYDAQGNVIAIGTTATVGKPGEGSGVIAPQKGSEFVATHAQAPNAQVVPNANIMEYLKAEAARFGLTSNPNYRYGEPSSQHAIGRALDLSGPPEQRRAFLEWWHSDPSRTAATRMLIDDNNTDLEAYAGVAGVGPYGRGDHGDHIHAALEGVPASAFMDPASMPLVTPSSQAPPPNTTATPSVSPSSYDWSYKPPSFTGGWANGPLPTSNTDSVRNRGVTQSFQPRVRSGSRSQTMGIKGATAGGGAGQPLPAFAGATGFPGEQLPTGDPAQYKQKLKEMARVMYLRAGMPPGEWAAFERLIEKESSWNPEAKNPSSTAYGLGQFLDITDAQYGPRSANPFVQLPRIFSYIRDRYDGSPAKALQFHNANNWYDRGGWLMPGQSHVSNNTGKPELIVPHDQLANFFSGGFMPEGHSGNTWDPNRGGWKGDRPELRPWFDSRKGDYGDWGIYSPGPKNSPYTPPRPKVPFFRPMPGVGDGIQMLRMPSFYSGGLNTIKAGAVVPRKPLPRPPDAQMMQPRPAPPRPQMPAPSMPPTPPPSAPQTPPAVGPGAPMQTPDTPTVQPARLGPGPGVGGGPGGGQHLHPAASMGIKSGFAAAGNIAASAASMGMGGMGGGAAGSLIAGAFGQAGKIVEGIANVGASFLVGTLTNGTTENPYGVTQRGSNPTGGTKVVDNSQSYGDVYTQSPREFFKQLDLREAQHSQASLAGYDRYA